MCPAVLDTESPVQYHQHKKMEDGFFPPISRKSAISMATSEPDPSEYNHHDRPNLTRGSVPSSLSGSPVKFPTIDRSNSTSVASLPGSRAARHRSHSRDLRSTYCRSPSCPSNLDMSSKDLSNMDFAIYKKRQVQTERTYSEMDRNDSVIREENSKLPSIFSKDFSAHNDVSHNVLQRNKPRDVTNSLSLHRSESLKNALNGTSESHTCNDSEPLSPRQNSTAALLLPLRTDTKVNGRKKKKSRRGRVRDGTDVDTSEQSPHSLGTFHEDALEAIARENRQDDDDVNSKRAIEINSSRKVKKWMNDNRATQKGEIKA